MLFLVALDRRENAAHFLDVVDRVLLCACAPAQCVILREAQCGQRSSLVVADSHHLFTQPQEDASVLALVQDGEEAVLGSAVAAVEQGHQQAQALLDELLLVGRHELERERRDAEGAQIVLHTLNVERDLVVACIIDILEHTVASASERGWGLGLGCGVIGRCGVREWKWGGRAVPASSSFFLGLRRISLATAARRRFRCLVSSSSCE